MSNHRNFPGGPRFSVAKIVILREISKSLASLPSATVSMYQLKNQGGTDKGDSG